MAEHLLVTPGRGVRVLEQAAVLQAFVAAGAQRIAIVVTWGWYAVAGSAVLGQLVARSPGQARPAPP